MQKSLLLLFSFISNWVRVHWTEEKGMREEGRSGSFNCPWVDGTTRGGKEGASSSSVPLWDGRGIRSISDRKLGLRVGSPQQKNSPGVVGVWLRVDPDPLLVLHPVGPSDGPHLLLPPHGGGEDSVADVHGQDTCRNHVGVPQEALGQCIQESCGWSDKK